MDDDVDVPVTKLRKAESIHEDEVRMAPEASVRRLARYCGVIECDAIPVLILIDELEQMGVVTPKHPRGMY